ncbi:MAG TPA: hypothetical protein VNL95_06140, partial [Dehalococcoidia bacterium]|nr:hypothetical protein [Dehalococcoidia bacterium]
MALASAGHAPADDQSDLRGHYALLQLSPDAELELVEQVYWHLAFKYHREGLRHELQRLNRAMAAVLSALGQGDAPRPTTSVAVGGRWGSVSRLAWDIWWLGASLAAPALAMGLTLAVVSPGGDLQALGRWQGVLLGSGAAGLGTLAAVAVLAAVVPPTVRSLGRRSTAPPGQTDHYAVLHLDPAASRDVVEVAYAHLAKAAGTRGDSARLSALQEAYRVLGDADRRAAYDGQRAA